jgi:hypothetical protein
MQPEDRAASVRAELSESEPATVVEANRSLESGPSQQGGSFLGATHR